MANPGRSEPVDRKAARVRYHGAFQQFYLTYPRKIDSTQAFNAFLDLVLEGVDPQFLITRAKAYASNVDPGKLQYVPSPKTWLRDKRFEDNDLLQDAHVSQREWLLERYRTADAAAVAKRYGFIFPDPPIPVGADAAKYHEDARRAWIGAVGRHVIHGEPLPE